MGRKIVQTIRVLNSRVLEEELIKSDFEIKQSNSDIKTYRGFNYLGPSTSDFTFQISEEDFYDYSEESRDKLRRFEIQEPFGLRNKDYQRSVVVFDENGVISGIAPIEWNYDRNLEIWNYMLRFVDIRKDKLNGVNVGHTLISAIKDVDALRGKFLDIRNCASINSNSVEFNHYLLEVLSSSENSFGIIYGSPNGKLPYGIEPNGKHMVKLYQNSAGSRCCEKQLSSL